MADARELACRFRACLQSEPVLIGWGVTSYWVRSTYPRFCAALNVAPVRYETFAHELAEVMPRRRRYPWKGGKRLKPFFVYGILDPATSVVAIAKSA